MEETKEILTTKTYTVNDLKQLFGEGKKDVVIQLRYGINSPRPIWSSRGIGPGDEEILKVEIKEPYPEKK